MGMQKCSATAHASEWPVSTLWRELRMVGLGELCSITVLLCYAPMLSNALIMLLRIVIMLTLCWLIIAGGMTSEHGTLALK